MLEVDFTFSWTLSVWPVLSSDGNCREVFRLSGSGILVGLPAFAFTVCSVLRSKFSRCSQTFLCPMYSIKVEKPVPHFGQLRVSNKEPNLFGFVFSLLSDSLSLFTSSGLSSASGAGLGSESRLVLLLLSEASLSVFSFLLALGVLGLTAPPSRLVIPNSARWAILHWSNWRVLPCKVRRSGR